MRALAGAILAAMIAQAAAAAEPVKVGCSMAMTGGVAAIGKQVLVALQLWKDDVNAKGGLLGRPVEIDCYDDQSNPSNVAPIYTKLIEVDKVDLLIGPYATNMVVPAIPVIAAHNMTTVGILANAANTRFHYPRYFSMLSTGPEPEKAFSTGFFELALQHKADLKTVAIIGANAEFAQNAIAGARANLKTLPFTTIFDRSYPPDTTDYVPIMRALQATNPDIVYVAAYPPDSVGIVRAADEIGLRPKMFGGTLIGLIVTTIKMQLGPLINGIVNNEALTPFTAKASPVLQSLIERYQAIAATEKLDPLGYAFAPFGYAAGQVLAEAVTATGGFDQDKIAQYIHAHPFDTVAGNISFGPDGEWTKSETMFAQFQHVTSGDLDQFRDSAHEAIVWPDAKKTGDLIFPYSAAKTP